MCPSDNPYQPTESKDPLLEAYHHREQEDNDRYQAAEARWPRCPECGQCRITRCPYCKTIGIRFPLADEQFSRAEFFADDEQAQKEGKPISTCGCSSKGCDSDVPDSGEEASRHPHPQDEIDPGRPPELTLLCPVCDEAFLPAFARQCEWCNHLFADGETFYVERVEHPGGPIPLLSAAVHEMGENPRVFVVLLMVLSLAVAGGLYLWWVVQ
jgi:hypothetical protein